MKLSETTSKPKLNFAKLFLFGIITRLIVLAIGSLYPQQAVNLNVINSPELYAELSSGWRSWIEPWYRWDAVNYLDITLNGYSYNGNPNIYSNVAFMPLLPLVIAISAKLGLDPYVSGLIIPNFAFSIGLIYFGQVIMQLTKNPKLVWRACILLCVFPTAFFFSAPYQESLGFLFTTIALWAWLNYKNWISTISLAIASTARQVTLAFSLAFILEWLYNFIKGYRRRNAAWLVATGAFFGISLVSGYMYWKFGDATLSSRVQAAWEREQPSILNIFKSLWPISFSPSSLLDYGTMLLFLFLSFHALRTRGIFWAATIALPIFLAMSTGTVLSMKRYALSSFPAFIDAAELIQNPLFFKLTVIVSAALQLFLIYWYVNWGFVHP